MVFCSFCFTPFKFLFVLLSVVVFQVCSFYLLLSFLIEFIFLYVIPFFFSAFCCPYLCTGFYQQMFVKIDVCHFVLLLSVFSSCCRPPFLVGFYQQKKFCHFVLLLSFCFVSCVSFCLYNNTQKNKINKVSH